MGMVEPRLKRRRGTTGLYAQPRNLLSAIPGAQLVEMPRIRENRILLRRRGRGTKAAYPDLANSSASCGWKR